MLHPRYFYAKFAVRKEKSQSIHTYNMTTHHPITQLEICCGSYTSAIAAQQAGAHRIELCTGLEEGGLTPSAGLIAAACRLNNIVHHVLIRPRGGDFLYTEEEQNIILDDINRARELGADGVVVGSLLSDGSIDTHFLSRCVNEALGMHVTFHRAFDLCANPEVALEQIIDCGCTHLLTSGQASTAEKGIPILRSLVAQAAGRIAIMPGCGVNADNAAHIIRETGATNIHASARALKRSAMQFVHSGVSMGSAGADEYAIKDTSEHEVCRILQALRSIDMEEKS